MPNETDSFFKNALDGLPDAPPPGVAFDADALWGNLDHQLRPRRRFVGWWVAAGITLLVLAGAGGWLRFSGEKTPAARVDVFAGHKANQPGRAVPSANPVKTPNAAKATGLAVATRTRRVTPLRGRNPLVNPMAAVAESLTNASANPVVSPEPVPELVASAVGEKAVFPEKKTGKPKPRFRVVPANELLAEEEARPKLYRSEGTARVTLGFPTGPQPAVAESSHVLMLTKKPD